jgi:hypothetical protein
VNRLPNIAVYLLLTALAGARGKCMAATGDVSFQAANKTVQLSPGNLATSIDVFFHVAGAANVPAVGWGIIVNIAPQAGATGTVWFNPPAIVNNQPNLLPASQTPFIDFDRDYGGKSYGTLGQSNTQLNAYSYYIAPTLGPPPPLDANGNLTLPDGKGLVSLPLLASLDASGKFNVSFDPDPVVTGVVYATGLPAPQDLGIHPAGTHLTGVLTLINLPGDYNANGVIDSADYVVWRKGLGTIYTQSDYDVWRAHFGQTAAIGASSTANALSTGSSNVPEPRSLLLLMTACLVTRFVRESHRVS